MLPVSKDRGGRAAEQVLIRRQGTSDTARWKDADYFGPLWNGRLGFGHNVRVGFLDAIDHMDFGDHDI